MNCEHFLRTKLELFTGDFYNYNSFKDNIKRYNSETNFLISTILIIMILKIGFSSNGIIILII